MDLSLRNQVVRSQRKLLNLIQIHQKCYEKISRGEEGHEMTEELLKIRADIILCNAEQSELLKQVSMSGSVLRCNIYQMGDLPEGALPSKNRRRKNIVSLTPAQEAAAVATVLTEPCSPPRASSPVNLSSESSDSEDDGKSESTRKLIKDLIAPCSSEPQPLQKLPKSRWQNPVQLPKMRRIARLSRRQKEQLAADIPVYPPSAPTPPPKDEVEAKLRFMKALQMLPDAEVQELRKVILARRSERKRRSAVNSPYSSLDWEMTPISLPIFGPVTRRQYLAAAKKEKQMAKTEKKGKLPEPAEVMALAEDIVSSASSGCESVGCTECGLEIKKNKGGSVPHLCKDCSAAASRARNDKINNNIQERGMYKMQLLQVLRSRVLELEQLKKSIIPLLESQALQERLQKDQIREQKELTEKIETLRNLVALYQMQPDKDKPSPSSLESPPNLDPVVVPVVQVPIGKSAGQE